MADTDKHDREMERSREGGGPGETIHGADPGRTQARPEEEEHGSFEDTKERAREGMEEVSHEAKRVGRDLGRAAEDRADRWTAQVSRQASSVARALEVAGEDLDRQGEPRFARWSEGAAGEVKRMAGYLEQEDPRSILRDVEQIARRNPGAFVGGTFAAGLLLGRFLRSSEPHDQTPLAEGTAEGP